jgi:hypothetical protein
MSLRFDSPNINYAVLKLPTNDTEIDDEYCINIVEQGTVEYCERVESSRKAIGIVEYVNY